MRPSHFHVEVRCLQHIFLTYVHLGTGSCQEAVTEAFSRGDGIGNVPVVLWGALQLMGYVDEGLPGGVTLPEPVWSGTEGPGINSVWQPKPRPRSWRTEHR